MLQMIIYRIFNKAMAICKMCLKRRFFL